MEQFHGSSSHCGTLQCPTFESKTEVLLQCLLIAWRGSTHALSQNSEIRGQCH